MVYKCMDVNGVDWIHLAQNRGHYCGPVNVVMNLQVP
jgi:hypothetical protein